MNDYHVAVALDQLRDGDITAIQVAGHLLAFYLVAGQPYCTEDLCTHEACSLSSGGYIQGFEVECPCHGARFDIRTGEVTQPPAVDQLRTFRVQIKHGEVLVELPSLPH